MVMGNAATRLSKTDLLALYDELEAKIRALESLGWTQDKYGEFLSPLVKSCLPEDMLLAFERSKKFKKDTLGEGRTLKLLMNFLKQEVKNDEMVELARNNFSSPVNQNKKEVIKPDKFPSAATLANTHDRSGTGMLCSVTISPKILLQNTWKLKLSWDSSLPDEIVKPFFKWWNEIEILSDVEILRYFEINDSTQMHVFVDICKEAYATCIFFRSNTSQGVKVALVRAKARVAPLKQVTIPRLELMACCIDAMLAYSVQESLSITEMETVF
ncbi:integrase catalytic domain-containing protein [Trichonephila clavipes]|nr:integrase catalytic domain-containing protein [Trichonephila clavipes]